MTQCIKLIKCFLSDCYVQENPGVFFLPNLGSKASVAGMINCIPS